MKSISMLEFRKQAESILTRVRQGQGFVLTYRGKPVARLEPIVPGDIADDDPLYVLAESAAELGESLTNAQIDKLIFGA